MVTIRPIKALEIQQNGAKSGAHKYRLTLMPENIDFDRHNPEIWTAKNHSVTVEHKFGNGIGWRTLGHKWFVTLEAAEEVFENIRRGLQMVADCLKEGGGTS